MYLQRVDRLLFAVSDCADTQNFAKFLQNQKCLQNSVNLQSFWQNKKESKFSWHCHISWRGGEGRKTYTEDEHAEDCNFDWSVRIEMYCPSIRETQLQNMIKIGDKTVRLRKRKRENFVMKTLLLLKFKSPYTLLINVL